MVFKNKDFTITMDLFQYWNDERLMFGNRNEYLVLVGDFIDRIWTPDTFIANDKFAYLHEVTETNKMLKIYGNGDIVYGMRFTTTLACMMNLRNYPLDSQNCTVEIESCKIFDTSDFYRIKILIMINSHVCPNAYLSLILRRLHQVGSECQMETE